MGILISRVPEIKLALNVKLTCNTAVPCLSQPQDTLLAAVHAVDQIFPARECVVRRGSPTSCCHLCATLRLMASYIIGLPQLTAHSSVPHTSSQSGFERCITRMGFADTRFLEARQICFKASDVVSYSVRR